MKKIILFCFIALGLSTFSTVKAQSISDVYFGVNAWMPDTIGDVNNCQDPPCIRYGKLHKNWKKVQDSKATIVRYGGIAPDQNIPTKYQYLRIVDSIQAKGMEPMLQVPFWDNRYTAAQAADIVHYINVIKGRNVKYWIIANEPNLSYGYTSAAQVAAYFKPFASAMKNADPSILIVGPETASFKKTIIDGLTNPGGPDDITGTDAAGRYYVDIISFHTYPLLNGTSTRDAAITKLTNTGSFKDNLIYLNTRLANCNSYHGRTGAAALGSAVTEANVNYTNSPSDDLYGIGANSFFGGQFVAEMYGIGLTAGVYFINLWSVIEGANSVEDNCGYIDPLTGNKKPLYYHFQMMAENFKGNSISATDNQPKVKTFASKNGTETTVMIMNQELATDFNYTVRLNTGAVSGTDPLKINVNAGIAVEYNEVLANQSTILLTFDASGALIKKTEYSLSGQAVANQPPLVTNYAGGPAPVACDVPAGLNADSVTSATARLNWTPTGAVSYNIRYKTLTSAYWTNKTSTVPVKKIYGLTPATTYEYQIASVCTGATSAWSASSTITTEAICTVPAGLNASTITATSATLNWTSTGAASYNVKYKSASSTTWTSTTATGTFIAISGLSAATAYEFQVAGVCSGTSTSAYSPSATFSTTAPACAVPGGLNSTSVASATATVNWSPTGAVSYNIRYKTLTSAYWTTKTSTSPTKNLYGLSPATGYEYQIASVCSGATSPWSASATFITQALCTVPSGLNASAITATSATLNWTSTGAASYNVKYKATASSTWISSTVTGTSKAISGLSAGTAYEFQVAGVCSSTSTSAYSPSATFNTTALACTVPGGLNATAITATSATLNWTTTGAASYNVKYKSAVSTTWTSTTATVTSKAISGLSAGTTYEFQVAGVCSSTSTSAYSSSATFNTTALACTVPGGLNATAITATSATLNWTSTGAASYNVQYKSAASTTWTSTTATGTSQAIFGLSASTAYEFQVAGVCSSTSTSAFSASATFNTIAPVSTILTVGTGTSSSAIPYATAIYKEHAQFIITKAELISAGYVATNNQIDALSFYVSTAGTQVMNNFCIRIAHISAGAFANTTFKSTSGAETVYTANYTCLASAWNKHEFTTPFIYNGADNLLIDISWSNASASVNSIASSSITSAYKTLYHSQASKGHGNAKTGTLTFNRPNMRFDFSQEVPSKTMQQAATGEETETFTGDPDLNLYPNPASSSLSITFNSALGQSARISVYNIMGALVTQIDHISESSGKQSIALDFDSDVRLSALTNGTYICCLETKRERLAKKFVLVK